MDPRDQELSEQFKGAADDYLRRTHRSSQSARQEILRRHRQRLTFKILAAAAVVLVTATSSVVAIGAFQNDEGGNPSPAAQPTSSPSDESSASPSPSPSGDPGNSDEVSIYLKEMNQDTFDKDSYVARPRQVRGQQDTGGRLSAVLHELVKGPNRKEQDEGLVSTFSSRTAHILKRVEVTDEGRAIVNFEDFTDEISQVSTTSVGTTLIFQLNQTIFQFSAIHEVEYQVEENCDAFWATLESECNLVRREVWETVQ
jgi:spore germination protein GerM